MASTEILLLEYNDLTEWKVEYRRWTLLQANLPVPLIRPVLTHINNVVYLTGLTATLLGSHWSSSYITGLSLVENFRVLKYFHSVATAALLCHKEPA